MSADQASHRRLFKATAVSGASAAIVTVIGLLKMKLFALWLGPQGIGLFGVYYAVMATAAVLAGMGLNVSGVRHLAPLVEQDSGAGQARRQIWLLTLPLAIAGGLALWLLSEPLAGRVLAQPAMAPAIAWLGVGVAVSVVSATQLIMLQAYRRIEDLAQARLLGALLGAVAGAVLVWLYRENGVLPALLAMPIGAVIATIPFSRRLPPAQQRPDSLSETLPVWGLLLKLGFVVMVAGLVAGVGQIAVRGIIAREFGLDAAGLYQSAASISANSISLILAAMASDYLPRLSAVANDPTKARLVVNQQIEVGLLLSGPLLILVITLAPQALYVAYSSEFTGAAQLLRWSLAGDMLRVTAWALMFVLVTRSASLAYFLAEASVVAVFIGLTWLLLPLLGLEGAGVAYWLSFIAYLGLAAAFCARFGVTMSGRNMRLLLLQAASAMLVPLLAARSEAAALMLGGALTLIFAAISVRRFQILLLEPGSPGFLQRVAGLLRRRR